MCHHSSQYKNTMTLKAVQKGYRRGTIYGITALQLILNHLLMLQKESLVRIQDKLTTLDAVVDADAKVCY